MIVLDTNVLSELMRPQPDARVVAWVAHQPLATLFTTSVTKAEILYGIGLLPTGRRKATLVDAAQRLLSEGFAGRILSFDEVAAEHYADIAVRRRNAGSPIEVPDAQIAAVAAVAGAAVATRDVPGFEGCGVDVINPWTA